MREERSAELVCRTHLFKHDEVGAVPDEVVVAAAARADERLRHVLRLLCDRAVHLLVVGGPAHPAQFPHAFLVVGAILLQVVGGVANPAPQGIRHRDGTRGDESESNAFKLQTYIQQAF